MQNGKENLRTPLKWCECHWPSLSTKVQHKDAPVTRRGSDFVSAGVPADFKDAARALVAVHQLPALGEKGGSDTRGGGIYLHAMDVLQKL